MLSVTCRYVLCKVSLLVLLAGVLLGSRSASAQTVHVVAPGHTLGKIARRYNTTVEALRETNGLSVGARLRPGQRLLIPGSTSTRPRAPAPARAKPARPVAPRAHTTHLVAEGQTLGRIARRYNTTVQALREANQLDPAEPLRPGTCLVVVLDGANERLADRRAPCRVDGATASGKSSYSARPKQRGVVHLIRGSLEWKGRLVDAKGAPVPAAAQSVKRLLASNDGETHSIAPRLLQLVVRVSDHFGGRPIVVTSGFRPESSNRYGTRSHHNAGEAIDFAVRGVPNDAVRDYCHTLERVGVGYYPNSSFVHLDTREVTTYWTDTSGPGEQPEYITVTAPKAVSGSSGGNEPRLKRTR